MTKFLLDTGTSGRFINRRDDVFERARAEQSRGNRAGICHPVLAELAYGAEYSASRDRNMQRLKSALNAWKLWPVTEEASFEYGRLAATLRKLGRNIQQNDIMVAAIALTLGNCVVVSMDSDLRTVPGLKVENWVVAGTPRAP
jgi:tRNA(fMet)-specific endonuclease VapC